MRRFTKIVSLLLAGLMLIACTGCTQFSETVEDDGVFRAGMATDTGGINDRSFNESSWQGLQEFHAKYPDQTDVRYLESKQEADYSTNCDKLVDGNCDLVFGVGYEMADAILQVADMNPDIHFVNVDNSFEDTPDNVTGVLFRAQEGAFLVGYIAALMTQTNQVGFVGGIESAVIDQFEYGYRAGVAYGAATVGKDVSVAVQYISSFSDTAKAKATANKMYTSGCDIVFHATGGASSGIIASAVDNGKYVIGVDQDQSYLAPENVITSSLKKVNMAVQRVCEDCMNGVDIGGQTLEFGISDGMVGIPEEHHLMGDEIYEEAMVLSDRIADGEIVPPYDEESFEQFDVQDYL